MGDAFASAAFGLLMAEQVRGQHFRRRFDEGFCLFVRNQQGFQLAA